MFKKLKSRLFQKPVLVKTGNGIFVTFDELMEQRKFVDYLKRYSISTSNSTKTGDIKSAFKGRGIELEEVRAYEFGDDIRDIDWKVTARKLSPYTRLYVEERDREVYVFLDLSSSMVFGTKKELKSVAAAKLAALLGWLSLENKDRFGVIIFDGRDTLVFKPQSSQKNMLAIFKKISETTEKIAQEDYWSYSSLEFALQMAKKSIKSQAIIFFISDFSNINDSLKKHISAIAKQAKTYFIKMVDRLEEQAPKSGEYMVQDYNDSLVFDSSSDNFKKEYKSHFASKRDDLKNFCNKFSIKYMEVRTDEDLYKQVKF